MRPKANGAGTTAGLCLWLLWQACALAEDIRFPEDSGINDVKKLGAVGVSVPGLQGHRGEVGRCMW